MAGAKSGMTPHAAARCQNEARGVSSEPIGTAVESCDCFRGIENLNCVAYARPAARRPPPVRSNSCCLHACEDAFLAHRSTERTAVQPLPRRQKLQHSRGLAKNNCARGAAPSARRRSSTTRMAAAAPAPAKPPPVKIDEPEELKGTKWSGMELESGTSTKDVAADSAFERVFERLYGKMTFEEKLRLIWLAGTLFFIIGGYWLLRSLKDPVIATICGVEYIPKAKMLSVLVVLVLVFVYNKLIDMFPKHQLFYIVGGFYAGLFTLIACLLAAPATAQTSIYNTNASPYRLIGWISYCSIESFGSIGVSLFWAFTNSTYNLEGAKKAYGLMVACAQLGSIAGPTLVSVGTEAYGVPTIYFCGALCMVAMV